MSSGKKARKNDPYVTNGFREVKPLNYVQSSYLESIRHNTITFGIGPAGTGKTYIAANYAAGELFYKRIDKIILTRPNVEIGPGLGFLPGELQDKYAPYIEPFDSIFRKALGNGFYEYALKTSTIDPKPLGFMRGNSYDNCIILIDECQNMTREEFKMVLSRIGRNCKVILSGDPDQADIPNSGLLDAVNRLREIDNIDVVEFLEADIVRSEMCKRIIIAYKN